MSSEQDVIGGETPGPDAIVPAVLQEIVRQDRRDPGFRITDWTAAPVGQKGFHASEALICVHGHGANGHEEVPWSVVLKILHASEGTQDPREIWYWKRELLLARSGLLANLPGGLLAARTYRTADQGTTAWIWMEYLVDSAAERWGLDHYVYAARQLGRFNAPYLAGLPPPDLPLLVREHSRSFAMGRKPLERLEDPVVRRAAGSIAPGSRRTME